LCDNSIFIFFSKIYVINTLCDKAFLAWVIGILRCVIQQLTLFSTHVECTSSWIQILLKNYIFCGFIVNSSVLFPNLLELFFSDHWVQLYKIRKAPYEKKTFSKKKFFRPNFKAFIAFFYTSIQRELPKNFFWIFAQFWPKYLKNDFWAYVMRQALFLWPGLSKFVRIRLKMIAMT